MLSVSHKLNSSDGSERKSPVILSKEFKSRGYSDQLVRYLSEPADWTSYALSPESHKKYLEQRHHEHLELVCFYVEQIVCGSALKKVRICTTASLSLYMLNIVSAVPSHRARDS